LVGLVTGGLIVDQQTREQFFINALVTEHFVLQAARGAMIGEMVGRGSIYLGTVSSALIAFGFIAQSELRLAPFVAAVLPALFVLGELTFVALLRDSFQNIEFLRRIQTIDQVEQLDLHAPAGSDLVPAPDCPVGCVRTPPSSNRAC
jgi:uncharacterized membrane protein YciS (DUF1049 family)